MKQNYLLLLRWLLMLVLFPCLGEAANQATPHKINISSQEHIPALLEEFKQDGQEVLNGKEFDEIPASVRGLIQIGEPAVPALTGLLDDDNPWVRWQVAWALEEMAFVGVKIENALPALIKCVQQDEDPQLHYPCVTALGRTGDPRAIPILQDALQSPSREIVVAAMKALGRLGPPAREVVPEIKAAAERLAGQELDDGHPVNGLLRDVLAGIGNETVLIGRRLSELFDAAQSGNQQAIRKLVVELIVNYPGDGLAYGFLEDLPKIKTPAAPVLEKLLEDGDPDIRKGAAEALSWMGVDVKHVLKRLSKPAAPGIVITEHDPLNIRSGPGTSYPIIGKATKGSTLMVKEATGEWYYVQLPDDTVGYAYGKYIRFLFSPPHPESNDLVVSRDDDEQWEKLTELMNVTDEEVFVETQDAGYPAILYRFMELSYLTQNQQSRLNIIQALANIDYWQGPQTAVPVLEELLKDDEQSIRESAAKMLSWIHQGASGGVEELFERWHPELVTSAKAGNPKAVKWLVSVAVVYPGDMITLPIIEELMQIGSPAVPFLLEELERPEGQRIHLKEPKTHIIWIISLLGSGARTAVPALEKLSEDGDQATRQAATNALSLIQKVFLPAQAGEPEARQRLVEFFLQQSGGTMELEAGKNELVRIGRPVVPLLQEKLGHSEEEWEQKRILWVLDEIGP